MLQYTTLFLYIEEKCFNSENEKQDEQNLVKEIPLNV